jgi:methionyl-tRNA formyltransferase
LIERYQPQFGVILGARVLRPEVIAAAPCPILNIHPGVLPTNRGLDTMQWAILNGWPQGVTGHLITNRIDHGPIVRTCVLGGIQGNESLIETSARLDSLQMICLFETMVTIKGSGCLPQTVMPEKPGEYHSRYLGPTEAIQSGIRRYNEQYPSFLEAWQAQNRDLVDSLRDRFQVFSP